VTTRSSRRARAHVAPWAAAVTALLAWGAEAQPGPTRIQLVGAGWTDAARETVREELARLPPRLQSFPGGVLEIELHPEPAPFGMGDRTPVHPEWSGGGRRFHLYGWMEPDDRRAAYRLERLSPALREELWRRRAIVHAVIERFDQHFLWSRRERWRDINGWVHPLERLFTVQEEALNRYAWAYSRERGMDSSAEDLATFAEEALVPATLFDPEAVPIDDQVQCQEFSKSRFLQAVLAPFEVSRPSSASCPAFERWARLSELSHIEVLFSAPSGAHIESLFGHLMLRPVYRSTGRTAGSSSERVMQIAALTGLGERLDVLLARGLTGGYPAVFSFAPLNNVLRQNLEIEQRSLRRWKLQLSEAETLNLMQRMWELERRGYPRYYFFTENCATQLLWIVNAALEDGRHVALPGTFWVMPTATLDAMANTQQTLLLRLPDEFRSHQGLAYAAEERRRSLDEWLMGASMLQQLESPTSGDRRAAYEQIPRLFEHALASGDVAERRLALRGLLDSITDSERYAADKASVVQEALDQATTRVPTSVHLPTSSELLAERQRLYEREDARARLQADAVQFEHIAEIITSLPHRERTAEEQRQWAEALEERSLFDRWTEIEGDVLERHFGADEPALVSVTEPERDSLQSSGYGYLSIGAMGGWDGQVLVSLDSALVRELMGDNRDRGFGPATEVHLLDARTALSFAAPGFPTVPRLDLTLIGFRSFVREPEIARRSFWDALGWGTQAEVHRDVGLGLAQRAQLGAQLYWIPWSRDSYRRFIAVGMGPGLALDANWLPQALLMGPRLELSARLPLWGHTVNALHIEASYLPQWAVVTSQAGRFEQDAAISGWIDLHTARALGHDVVLGVGAEARARRLPGRTLQEMDGDLRIQWM
jgi:hypothetical protein